MSQWALVLSGGGSKGIAHIGALQALESLNLRPDLIVGCSMGAIISGLYCSGMSTAEMTDWVENRFELNDHMNLDHMEFADSRLWKLLQDSVACDTMRSSFGLDKRDSMLNLFRELTGDRLVEKTAIPLIINAVDLLTSRQVELDSGNLATAMRASMAIPGVFEPVLHNGQVLVDGGIWDNMPVAIARQRGFQKVIAINVGKPLKIEHLGNAMSILAAAVWTSGKKPNRQGVDKPSLEIKVDVQVENTDFGEVQSTIHAGKKEVLSYTEDILNLL